MSINISALSTLVSRTLGNTSQDQMARNELFNYEFEKNRYDIDYKKSYLKTRKWVGFFTFLLVWLWLLAMLYFILAKGLGRLPYTNYKFDLSDTVIITLITTATLNVVTFLVIVIKNLYPSSENLS